MRVTSVDLYSANFEQAISFSLEDSEPGNQYQIRNIVGLDAEEIVPKFYGSGLVSNSKYYDFGMKSRDIVMRVVLNPNFRIDESYSDVRDELYRAISATRTGLVELHFKSGTTIVSHIMGSIVKFEVPYFVRLPEVQLTVRCPDPMFRSVIPAVFISTALGDDPDLIVPDNTSTAPHGFIMEVVFNATSASFTIQDVETDPEWKFKIVPSGGFLSGDLLYISTEYSNKQIYMVRGGVTTQLVDKLEPGSIWPIIFPGPNRFFFVDRDDFDWDFLQYYAAYWGV